VESAVVAALAGILGLALGRFWDRKSESTRWRRNQRVRCYQNLVQAYYYVREMVRMLGAAELGTKASEIAADRVRKAGVEWSCCVVTVWLYGSEPVTAAAKELDSQFNNLFHNARNKQLEWDEAEWRRQRVSAETTLERLVLAIRQELALPAFPINILWHPDPSNAPDV
jgi:hypothetical protein